MKNLAFVTAACVAGMTLVAPIHQAAAGKGGGATAAATTSVKSTPSASGAPKSASESVPVGGGVNKYPCSGAHGPNRCPHPY